VIRGAPERRNHERRNEKAMNWNEAKLEDETTWCPSGEMRWVAVECKETGEKDVGLFCHNGKERLLFTRRSSVNDGRNWAITHWAPTGIVFPPAPSRRNEVTQ
jgi:hypothetical protein